MKKKGYDTCCYYEFSSGTKYCAPQEKSDLDDVGDDEVRKCFDADDYSKWLNFSMLFIGLFALLF